MLWFHHCILPALCECVAFTAAVLISLLLIPCFHLWCPALAAKSGFKSHSERIQALQLTAASLTNKLQQEMQKITHGLDQQSKPGKLPKLVWCIPPVMCPKSCRWHGIWTALSLQTTGLIHLTPVVIWTLTLWVAMTESQAGMRTTQFSLVICQVWPASVGNLRFNCACQLQCFHVENRQECALMGAGLSPKVWPHTAHVQAVSQTKHSSAGVKNVSEAARRAEEERCQNQAASRIQAAYRGHSVRQHMAWKMPKHKSVPFHRTKPTGRGHGYKVVVVKVFCQE